MDQILRLLLVYLFVFYRLLVHESGAGVAGEKG
jgi:hypothetical protein